MYVDKTDTQMYGGHDLAITFMVTESTTPNLTKNKDLGKLCRGNGPAYEPFDLVSGLYYISWKLRAFDPHDPKGCPDTCRNLAILVLFYLTVA